MRRLGALLPAVLLGGIALLLLPVPGARAGGGGDPQVGDLISAATESFRGAVATEGMEPRRAAFEQAARSYERALAAAAEGGRRNGALEYNTANAWFLAGDPGRAILHYRRALLLRPGSAEIAANLATARSRRRDTIEEDASRAVLETVFFWHRGLSFRAKLDLALAAWAAGLLLLAGAAWRGAGHGRGRALARGGAAALLVAVAAGASFLVEHAERGRRDGAVVVAEEVSLRKGDGASYAPRYENPVHSGAEVRIVEVRPGWVDVELADGKRGWVPVSAVERI